MPNFKGKKIIITGASKGLGAVAARSLSELGANLVLIARSKDKLAVLKNELENKTYHHIIASDLTDMTALNSAITESVKFLGEVNCVLHAAGGGLGFRSELIEQNDLIKLFTLNVSVAAEINRILVPKMKEKRCGNLVHVGSIAASEAVGSVGYNTVKAALSAYVRSLGRELATHGIIVTGILPGGFLGPDNAMERLKASKPEVYEKFIEERLPRKVMGDARELMPLIQLLLSDQASMMGGSMIPIDAGEGKAYTV